MLSSLKSNSLVFSFDTPLLLLLTNIRVLETRNRAISYKHIRESSGRPQQLFAGIPSLSFGRWRVVRKWRNLITRNEGLSSSRSIIFVYQITQSSPSNFIRRRWYLEIPLLNIRLQHFGQSSSCNYCSKNIHFANSTDFQFIYVSVKHKNKTLKQ